MLNYTQDPRWNTQRAIIDTIKNYFEEGEKFILVRGPTGFGKSPTGLVLAKEIGSAYITSPQVVLVDQYRSMLEKEFIGFGKSIKGLSNYKCAYAIDAANGPCHIEGFKFPENGSSSCPQRASCEYYVARDLAINSKTTVMTFHYFMHPIRYSLLGRSDVELPNNKKSDDNDKKYSWGKRKLLIIDEAHDLPEVLRDFFSLTVRESTFGKKVFEVLKKHQMEKGEDLLNILKAQLTLLKPTEEEVLKYMVKVVSQVSEGDNVFYQGHTYSYKDFLSMIHQESNLIKRIEHYLSTISLNADWVASRENEGAFVWKPYEAGIYMKQLFDKFDYVVLMSATFIDHKLYADRLQIHSYKFIDIPSRFDPNQAKVYLYYDNWLRKDSTDAVKGRVVAKIESIAEKYRYYKGIIHCHTYAWQRYIYEMANQDLRHRFIIHEANNRSQALMEFYKEKNPKILLSVNMGQGIDLKDDLARWQIIVKAPFPYIGDPWVQKHRERTPAWFVDNTIVEIIQACGRIVRTDTDWGHTYILDGNASRLLDDNRDRLPPWFVQRLQHIREKKR